MTAIDLDRRAAEMLGWVCNDYGNGRVWWEVPPTDTVFYKPAEGQDYAWFSDATWSPTTDWRQAGALLEMGKISLKAARLESAPGCWFDGWKAATPGKKWSEGQTPQLAIVRAFIAWLEPMTPEERKKALGRG